jgi:hypothetical protein
MARRPNYGYEKRTKELEKQRKQAEKAEKKRARKEAGAAAADGIDFDADSGAMQPSDASDDADGEGE